MRNKIFYSFSILITLIAIALTRCSPVPQESQILKYMKCDSAAVVTAHPEASRIGLDILKKGGNAIDAAIAVQFALSVCYPIAGNIGGGGFLIYRDAEGFSDALDFREKAPLSGHEKMFLDSLGNVLPGASQMGHLAAGVPGSVDGMYKAFLKYSRLKDWKALIQPAINLAEDGFKLTSRQAENLNNEQEIFIEYNETDCAFIRKDGFAENDLMVQPDLALTLSRIRDFGRDGFYKGETARLLIEEMEKNNGIIRQDDLDSYSSVWRKPIITKYKNYKITGMPPPSSGGIILGQLLLMAESFPLDSLGFQSPEAVHLMAEMERRAYADRALYLGDPDYFDVPVQDLLDPGYIKTRISDIDSDSASTSIQIHSGSFYISEETTHFSIVDKWRNAVAVTTTLNDAYGSRIMVDGAGFLLNNEMDDFSVKPGVPNLYGLIGAEANKIESGKRMLSSMTPTIVEKEDQLFLVVGTPGGSTIITTVFQIIMNITTFGLDPFNGVDAPRFHHQWIPDKIFIEQNCLDDSTRSRLIQMGHNIEERSDIGRVELIMINKAGKLEAAADPRGDDHVSGY